MKENIKHTNDKFKGTDKALSDKSGHIEDLTGLFIALCRAEKIPARTVWVPDYCYAEFYLEDAEGKGYWFPCELKEKTVFGTASNDYMIMQKGDNIKVPEKEKPYRFVPEFVEAKGTGRPQVSFVRQVVPMNASGVSSLWMRALGLLPAPRCLPCAGRGRRTCAAAIRLTNPRTERWQFGVVVRARGETTGIVATLPVPMPWPEQDVKVVAEDTVAAGALRALFACSITASSR